MLILSGSPGWGQLKREEKVVKVIAFDAAKRRTGYAYRAGDVWVTGVFAIHEYAKIIDVIKHARLAGCTHAAIEEPFCGRNINTLKGLQDAQSRIAQRCEDAGLEWVGIRATEWQSAQGCLKRGEDTKARAAALARTLDAPPYLSQDEVDAVCLCDYVERNMAAMDGKWKARGRK